GTPYFDAMGPYPLFFCEHWENLTDDLNNLSEQLISVSMVVGPFSDIPLDDYNQYFEVLYPYKDHYILDTSLPLIESISKHGRIDARRALKDVTVEHRVSPDIDLDEWVDLYHHLIIRHNISGIRAFSRESFAKQLAIPNTHYFRAVHNGEVVAGNLFYIQDNVAYGHLLAITPLGYKFGASHANKWVAIQHLSKTIRWISYGGGTVKNGAKKNGLDAFKLGWSNTIRKSYFIGKVMQKEIYDHLTDVYNQSHQKWFPSYRTNDF
ncbi:MAG TPA: hypothetical protein VK856_07745, partial [Anaerolineaceae bacterium]|nr:hypothetical protein [Anaerolineaceae bacterium]